MSTIEQEILLFSPLKFKILSDDKPVSKTPVRLWLKLGKQEFIHNYRSTVDGIVTIPRIEHKIAEDNLPNPDNPIYQEIAIATPSSKPVWMMFKINQEEYSELGGVPQIVECDLSDVMDSHKSPGGELYTSLKYEEIELA